jgi:hypothetical protein
MARAPELPAGRHKYHQRDTKPVVRPEGKFHRPHTISITTQRSPKSVTSINPDDMKPILPEMPYIPPA